MAEPATPPTDDKDWTWVLQRPCPECGFDARALQPADIGGRTREVMGSFTARLRAPGAADRPSPQVWSPLEYACHVRDVCGVFGGRLQLMLTENDPQFPNWDQDETALTGRYWEQDAATVADECASAAATIAAQFDAVSDEQWTRRGTRSNGSVFTVDTLGRYFLHDLVHHVHDITG